MDIDTIEGGEDFAAVIEEKIKECDALVAVIGKGWLTSTRQNGGRRLDDARDYVRLEIAKALIRGIRVIPVLVGGATIPGPNDLPEELVPLSGRQALELRDAHFHQDTQRLIDVLHKTPGVVKRPGRAQRIPPGRFKLMLISILFVASIVAGILLFRPSNPGAGAPVNGESPAQIHVGPTNDSARSPQAGPTASEDSKKPAKWPADVAGKWEATVKYNWGDTHTEVFWFELDGQELSGTASYVSAGRGILDGKIDGNRITFTTKSFTMLGDKTYEEKHHYGGTVEGDTIRFSLLTDSGYDSRTPEHFTAKRVAAIVSPVASSTPQPTANPSENVIAQTVRTLESNGAVISVAVTSDGRRAVSNGNALQVWNLASYECERSLSFHTLSVEGVAVTPNGHQAVSGSQDSTLEVWDLNSGQIVRPLKGHTSEVRAVVVTPDGRCAVSASEDRTLRLWDLESGQTILTLKVHTDSVAAVAVTPDSRHAVSGSVDKTLRVWDLKSGQTVRTLKGHTLPVLAVAVTPDGRRAVSGSSDDTLRVWDLETGQTVRILQGHTHYVLAVAVTPDGRHAVSGSADKTLRVWDLKSGQTVRTLKGHTGPLCAVAVTPDGRRAVSGSNDGTLRVWDLESGG